MRNNTLSGMRQSKNLVQCCLAAKPADGPIHAGPDAKNLRQQQTCAARVKRNTIYLLLILLVIPLLTLQVHADISIDKPQANVGDVIHIRIDPAVQTQTLLIVTPTTTYRFIGGVPQVATFIPQSPGVHTVRLLDENSVVDSATFTVLDGTPAPPPQVVFSVSSQEISTGEPLIINAPILSVASISVRSGTMEKKYFESTRPITYIPETAGQLVVLLQYVNGTQQNITVTVKGPNDPFISTQSPSPPQSSSITAAIVQEPTVTIQRNTTVVRQTTLANLDAKQLDSGKYDIDLHVGGRSLQKIKYHDLVYDQQNMDFRAQEVDTRQIKGNIAPGTIEAFAIDPTNLDFTSATITFIATGYALYKCVDYNYTTQECFGENRKVMDLTPGLTYTLDINATDPLFSQTGYLTNPNFDSNTNNWTTLTSAGAPTFNWGAADSTQSGVAQINLTGSNKHAIGSYYQQFNVTVPAGTVLGGINFSVMWHIPAFSANGNFNLSILNSARTAVFCNDTNSFAATNSWTQENMTTGTINCPLGNFTVNTNYTFSAGCTINTGPGTGSVETCSIDNASVIVWYNDTTAPVLRNIVDTPDPVNYSDVINISVNVTDNIQVGTVLVQINGANYTMINGGGDIYYFDGFSTALPLGVYNYIIFANDTNNNIARNNSPSLNFTIRDVIPPVITLLAPADNNYTTASVLRAFYNLSDQIGVSNCSLNVSNAIKNSTLNPPLSTTLNLSTSILSDGVYYWNITCNDTSNNRNTSATRIFVRDTINPTVILNTANNTKTNISLYSFLYTPNDTNLANCTLWGVNGTWAANTTDPAPTSNALDTITPTTIPDGNYTWNIQCLDKAGSSTFNNTNYTIVIDTVSPVWSNIVITPANNSQYTGSTYQFNITWTDDRAGLAVVNLETNFTGSLANTTPTKSGNVYTVSFSNVAVGDYSYKWYANDSASNQNSTTTFLYRVQKATSDVNLTFNGTSGDRSVGLNDFLNLTVNMTTPSNGYVELYLDGVRINNGSAPISNLTQFTLQKRYNVTAIYNTTQNYTAAIRTYFVTVVDTIPPTVALGNPANASFLQNNVTFFYTPSDNIDITNCTVVLDGVNNKTNLSTINVENNILIQNISEGLHNWTVNCSDSANNTAINTTLKFFTVDITPPAAFNLTQPRPGNISSNLSPTFIWNQTTETNFNRYTLQIDNDINFGSINFQVNTSPITNVSAQVAVTDQAIWYWRVIAFDLAGNTKTSNVFNYTADATAPSITQTGPLNASYTNTTLVNFTYTVSDFTSVMNCSLFVNGKLNQTNTTISATNYFLTTATQGPYNWSLACYDAANNLGTTGNFTFIVDTTPPTAFSILSPANNTLSQNTAPLYNWSQTTEANFDNYTVQVSDESAFSHVNYSITAAPITQTNVSQTPALTEGTWFWRVIAKDLAGNTRTSSQPFFNYTVDTTSPTAFDLVAPANDTETRNTTPLLEWQQSNDLNFKNYTIIVSDHADFSTVNLTNYTLSNTALNATITFPVNVRWYWKVVAYDLVGHSTNSTSAFTYLADYIVPNITLISPANTSTVTTSNLVPFQFNITDLDAITNCSLYLDDVFQNIILNPPKQTTVSISANANNGNHTWYVSCYDAAGAPGNSTRYNFTANVQLPKQIIYETSVDITNYTTQANINLSYSKDATENTVGFGVNINSFAVAANASISFNGSGLLIYNNTVINFTGVFDQSNANSYFVTWKLYVVNTSATTLICQYGDDNTGGAGIGTVTKKAIFGNCTNTIGDIRFFAGDNLTLTVDVFNSGASSRTFDHYWDNNSNSSVQFDGFKLGTLNASFVNFSDPAPSEGGTYVEQCNTTCTDGTCLGTSVYLQLWNGSAWLNVSTTGNITLNGTQVNPVSLGNINSSTITNFTLYGNLYSFNNTLECFATSTYSTNTSAPKNVSVIDRTLPVVMLNSPLNASAFSPQNVTFQYTATDLRLANCTLWGNWTGWKANQTNTTPVSATLASFAPVSLDYGVYLWNVQCYDKAGNSAFNSTNFTLYIAGDLEIVSANITFNPANPVETQNVTLIANITNRANRNEPSVVVQFWDGDPSAGGTQINGNNIVSFGPLGYNTTTTNWTATIGTHNIYVVVDPGNLIIESNEANNKANKTLFVSMWQVYYGNITGNITLGPSSNSTFANWFIANKTGNIYISDTDTTNGIKFQFLKALGRNTTGGSNANTNNDFTDLDTLLGTASYTDSVNSTYTSGGSPVATRTFNVFGTTIANVPISNSSGNFSTGILWDSDDSTNSFFDTTDKEDIIFVTQIKNSTLGANGVVDYEIKIPSALKNYKGATSTVTFYYELQ